MYVCVCVYPWIYEIHIRLHKIVVSTAIRSVRNRQFAKHEQPTGSIVYAILSFLHVADKDPISVSKERFGHAMYPRQVHAPRSNCVSNFPPAQAGRQIANMITSQLTVLPL